MRIITLYENNKSYFLYGAFWLVILLWIGYGYLTKYDKMLEDSNETRIYLNLDGSFSDSKFRDLEKNKGKQFWIHQLSQVDKRLANYRKLDDDYLKSVPESRNIRNRLSDESYVKRLNEAQSDMERKIIQNSRDVSQIRQRADDLEEDNRYRLAKDITEKEIPRYEALRVFILRKLDQYK